MDSGSSDSMVSEDGSCWVHFRKLPHKGMDKIESCRAQLLKLAGSFGKVSKLIMLMGRGQALLEMDNFLAATAVISFFSNEDEVNLVYHPYDSRKTSTFCVSNSS